MKPGFLMLVQSYPRKAQWSREKLYDDMGWPDLKTHPAYMDTCAIRMSIALNGAGVDVSGELTVKAGALKGRHVEPSQARLSRWLRAQWGVPEIFKSPDEARTAVGNRTELVSFFGLHGSSQGHIDLVQPDGHGFHSCMMECYFASRETWFWPVL